MGADQPGAWPEHLSHPRDSLRFGYGDLQGRLLNLDGGEDHRQGRFLEYCATRLNGWMVTKPSRQERTSTTPEGQEQPQVWRGFLPPGDLPGPRHRCPPSV